MRLFKSFFRRPTRTLAPRPRLRVERLECRDLLSAPSVMAIANAEYAQDGLLTRSDVIDLLETVAGTEQATITNGIVSFRAVSNPDPNTPLPAASFSDLQSIVANPGQWGITPHVAYLAGVVVGGYNLANENYQGNTLLASGELAANDPAYELTDLVGKWFLGNDLPAYEHGTSYEAASGTLFGPNGPVHTDIAQGAALDCYFLSSLGETALQSPQTIKSMFIENGDGTFTVRFYEDDASTNNIPQARWVTVNRELPVNSSDEFVYANYNFGGASSTNITHSNNVLWVALAEKAYAQLAEEGWSRSGWSAPINDYASLDRGSNLTASLQISGGVNGGPVKLLHNGSAQASATLSTLAADLQAGDLLTVCSFDPPPSVYVIPNHVYFITAVDVTDDSVTLVNPYTTKNHRIITLKLDGVSDNGLADNFGSVAVVEM